MAKDKNDTSTIDMNKQTQYRVNFTYVDNKFNLRQGSIIIPADSPEHAKLTAGVTLQDRFEHQYRITGVKVW